MGTSFTTDYDRAYEKFKNEEFVECFEYIDRILNMYYTGEESVNEKELDEYFGMQITCVLELLPIIYYQGSSDYKEKLSVVIKKLVDRILITAFRQFEKAKAIKLLEFAWDKILDALEGFVYEKIAGLVTNPDSNDYIEILKFKIFIIEQKYRLNYVIDGLGKDNFELKELDEIAIDEALRSSSLELYEKYKSSIDSEKAFYALGISKMITNSFLEALDEKEQSGESSENSAEEKKTLLLHLVNVKLTILGNCQGILKKSAILEERDETKILIAKLLEIDSTIEIPLIDEMKNRNVSRIKELEEEIEKKRKFESDGKKKWKRSKVFSILSFILTVGGICLGISDYEFVIPAIVVSVLFLIMWLRCLIYKSSAKRCVEIITELENEKAKLAKNSEVFADLQKR